jgi:transcriptional regulator with XRE-family HTH domain
MPKSDAKPLDAKLFGEALRRVRVRADLTQEKAAERMGVTRQAWQNYEKGDRQAVLRSDLQERLAEALGVSRADLLQIAEHERSSAPPPSRASGLRDRRAGVTRPLELMLLPVRDRVQAGAWLLADDTGQDYPRTYPAARDARFPNADQWLSEVVGDSVNRLGINHGDLVHLVDATGIGYSPRSDDIVEIERLRFDGAERELTLKQVEVRGDRVLFWPRSTNARWTEPVVLLEDVAEEAVEVRIRGLVLASIRRF